MLSVRKIYVIRKEKFIEKEEVAFDDETLLVKMSNNYYDEYEGNYVYTFEEEGSNAKPTIVKVTIDYRK